VDDAVSDRTMSALATITTALARRAVPRRILGINVAARRRDAAVRAWPHDLDGALRQRRPYRSRLNTRLVAAKGLSHSPAALVDAGGGNLMEAMASAGTWSGGSRALRLGGGTGR